VFFNKCEADQEIQCKIVCRLSLCFELCNNIWYEHLLFWSFFEVFENYVLPLTDVFVFGYSSFM
jgi:hypothetical protein